MRFFEIYFYAHIPVLVDLHELTEVYETTKLIKGKFNGYPAQFKKDTLGKAIWINTNSLLRVQLAAKDEKEAEIAARFAVLEYYEDYISKLGIHNKLGNN